MKNRGQILRAHYIAMVKKIATYGGVFALLAAMFVSMPVYAFSQVTSRSGLMGSSVPSASTTYTFNWTTPSSETGTTYAISFALCTSPLQGSCTGATGASFTAGPAVFSAGGSSSSFSAGWALGTGATTCPVATASTVCIYKAAGVAFGASQAESVEFTTVQNPSITGEFYGQISTYTAINPESGLNDYGGLALSTAQQMTVSANVQEALTFCVGNTSNTSCASIGGATVPLNTSGSTSNPLSSSVTSYGNAYMDAFTNGQGGYVISYTGTSLTSSAGTITNAASGGTTMTGGSDGTEMFGFNVVNNTAFGTLGAEGAAPSPNAATSYTAGYGTSDDIAYNSSSQQNVLTMTGANSNVNDLYSITYGCNISSTTKAGAYTATQAYLATATF